MKGVCDFGRGGVLDMANIPLIGRFIHNFNNNRETYE